MPDAFYRIRKAQANSSGCLAGVAFLLLLAGLAFSGLLAAVGVILLLVSFCIPTHYDYSCECCGDTVAATSHLCPACRMPLGKTRGGSSGILMMIGVAVVVLVGLTLLLLSLPALQAPKTQSPNRATLRK